MKNGEKKLSKLVHFLDHFRSYIHFFLLCQQQLEQLQKELNFLEEDIKRVEVN